MFIEIISVASIYIIIALGYILIYYTSKVLNFAVGEIFMIGGYLGFAFFSTLSIPPMVLLPLSFIAGAILGVIIYYLAMSATTGHSIFSAVMITIALGIMIKAVALMMFGGQIIYPGRVYDIEFGIVNISSMLQMTYVDLMIIASAIAITLLLFGFLGYSRIGIRMRACAEDPKLAGFRGLHTQVLFAASWGIATAIVAYGSVLYSFNHQTNPSLGEVALRALAVALIGGMNSIRGAIPAALIVAALEVTTQRFISTQASQVVPYVLLLLVLLMRPWGLFGTKEAIDRV